MPFPSSDISRPLSHTFPEGRHPNPKGLPPLPPRDQAGTFPTSRIVRTPPVGEGLIQVEEIPEPRRVSPTDGLLGNVMPATEDTSSNSPNCQLSIGQKEEDQAEVVPG